jgi:signal transduction histidine kinase
MLRRLRLQLSALYLLAALSLVTLVGVGAYSLLRSYLETTTDLALQYKMASYFRSYGLQLPPELASAERTWLESYGRTVPTPTAVATKTLVPTAVQRVQSSGEDEGESENAPNPPANSVPQPASQAAHPSGGEVEANEDQYNGELASVFVIPLDAANERVPAPNVQPAPILQDRVAGSAALQSGEDLRTSLLPDGNRVRLLTYRTNIPNGPVLLQAGRLLRDQERILRSFLTGLLALAGISIVLLGVGSWWLSGRSLGPAQRAWDQQQAFISNASHELRTPLTLIKASADYGLRTQSGADQEQLFDDILQESDYMNRLVDDLLTLSRLDTRRLKLSRQPVDLSILLEDVRRQAEKLAAEKNVAIRLVAAGGSVLADPTRLRQVLLILLDNAVRYTPPGGLVQLETSLSGRHRQIIVSDNGYGIPAQNLPHVFERFYQVNQPGVEVSRSNGLGLSIAKGLMEAQDGTIAIESRVGEGTRVTLTLSSAERTR